MNKDQNIQDGTVAKALHLLDIVAHCKKAVRFNDILELSPFPKATTYRFLQTLTKQRMLTFNPDYQTYSLGGRLVRLAHFAWQQSSIAPIARPHMDLLSKKTSETVHLSQLDGGQVLYVDKRNATNPIMMQSDAGKIGPAYCTGVGKAMLAFLGEKEQNSCIEQQSFHPFTKNTITNEKDFRQELHHVFKEGFAFDNEEHEQNIICIGVPILSSRGRVLGGISITSSTERSTLKQLRLYYDPLKETAEKIGESLEDFRFPETG